MFERFTERARRVVVSAQEEARLLIHNDIGTEHLLLALLHDGESVAGRLLASLGISTDAARRQVMEIIGHGNPESPASGHMPFTPAAKMVLELSLRESLQLGHDHIGTEHLLVGLVREKEGVAARVLVSLGADLERLRAHLTALPPDTSTETVASTMVGEQRIHSRIRAEREDACSFCGRALWEVQRHVRSTSARICGECVEACRKLLEEAAAQNAPRDQALRLPPRVFGVLPVDADVVRDVTQAFTMACGGARDDEERAHYIEDGAELAPLLSRSAARYPGPVAAAVHAIRLLNDDHAQAELDIAIFGTEFPFTGDAVRRDARWLVTSATIRALLARAGITPPGDDDA